MSPWACAGLEKALEGGVPDPGDVRAVGDLVVEAEHGGDLSGEGGKVVYGPVAARGVLDEDHGNLRAVELEALHPAEAALYVRERAHRGLGLYSERRGCGDGRRGVIEVVGGGQADRGGEELPSTSALRGCCPARANPPRPRRRPRAVLE